MWRGSAVFCWSAYGDPILVCTVLLVLSMIVYDRAFDFFNISGSGVCRKKLARQIRASAQGMFLL
ncbi:hypothetical protein ACLK1S_18290 [Escherichia coli]